MELTLRPYISAGVVIAGAGLIAGVPVGPAALEIQTRAVQLASVDAVADLMPSQEFPIASWTDAYNDTVANLQEIEAQIAADPHPILSAIDTNLADYANELASAAQTSSSNLTSALQDLATTLSNAVSDLQSGDVYDAETSLWQALLQDPLSVTRPIQSAYFEILQSIVNNIDNVFNPPNAIGDAVPAATTVLATPVWLGELETAGLFGPNAAEFAMAGVTQDIINAWQNGDTTLALNDLSNAASTIIDAYFNGYPIDDGGAPFQLVADYAARIGLDPSEGALNGGYEGILRVREILAADLGGRGLETYVADAPAAASSTGDLNTVIADVSSLLSPDTALGDVVTAFDPNAVADISSLLSAELAPNASGWVVDLFSLF